MLSTASIFLGLVATIASAAPLTSSPLERRAGQTYFAVGQNYLNEWNGFASALKKPAGISVYSNIYAGTWDSETAALFDDYGKSGATGVVEVGLSWKDDQVGHGYTQFEGARVQNDIAAGKWDAGLEKIASELAKYPNVQYLLRPDYEVSGNMHANTDASKFDPATWDFTAYPKAFRHVKAVLDAKVPNIKYIFHPVRGSAADLYPGDDVVDYQGFSLFNNDVCMVVGTTTNCPDDRVDINVQKDIDFAKKPKWVAESAPQPPISGSSATFIDYLERVRDIVEKNDFAGWTFINSLWTAHGWTGDTWGDSRIEANPEVKAWFETNVLNNPRYMWG